MREMTQSGDPMLRIRLPQPLVQALKAAAKQNKRRYQDEMIKRMSAIYKSIDLAEQIQEQVLLDLMKPYQLNQAGNGLMMGITPPHNESLLTHIESGALIKYAQVLPADMLAQLKLSAVKHSLPLEIEVASLLLVSFVAAKNLGLDTTAHHLINYKTSRKQAEEECKRKRQGWQYLFEIEKLKLYLSMKNHLPRNFKENFLLIDVKRETERLLNEQTRK